MKSCPKCGYQPPECRQGRPPLYDVSGLDVGESRTFEWRDCKHLNSLRSSIGYSSRRDGTEHKTRTIAAGILMVTRTA